MARVTTNYKGALSRFDVLAIAATLTLFSACVWADVPQSSESRTGLDWTWSEKMTNAQIWFVMHHDFVHNNV